VGDTFIISGLKEKRSAVAGQIIELRGQIDRLQADLFHMDRSEAVRAGLGRSAYEGARAEVFRLFRPQ
jgi:hypothetical protein